jgi:hypothetical protein
MHVQTGNVTEADNVPLCKTREQYQALLLTLYDALYARFTSTECSYCKPQCETLTYQTTIQTMTMLPERFLNPHGGYAVIFYPSGTELKFIDTHEYGTTSYVSDVFANLGFVTGFSLLTIFVGVERVMEFLNKIFRSKSGKTISSSRKTTLSNEKLALVSENKRDGSGLLSRSTQAWDN